jgi:hypothetical protein
VDKWHSLVGTAYSVASARPDGTGITTLTLREA